MSETTPEILYGRLSFRLDTMQEEITLLKESNLLLQQELTILKTQLAGKVMKLSREKSLSSSLLRVLLDPRVDPSAKNNAAIRGASAKSHTEIVKHLLHDSRVNLSAGDNHAI